jgi:hypothetical protein
MVSTKPTFFSHLHLASGGTKFVGGQVEVEFSLLNTFSFAEEDHFKESFPQISVKKISFTHC